MPNSQNVVSPEQFSANRANAAKSTGPRTPEGRARSAQNARKHGLTAAAYTVAGLEDAQDLANLREDALAFYQPENSQESFAVERIALTQLALLRAARLEAALFSSCLGLLADPAAPADGAQSRNLALAQGFERSASGSNALSLSVRYSAHAERQHRRAVAEFDRLKAFRSEIPIEPKPAAGLGGGVSTTLGETKPFPPQPTEDEPPSVFDCVPWGSKPRSSPPNAPPSPNQSA